ncbi:MAG: hypothetical protein AAGC74_04480 [Verrucomicrobiota bacterium]
MTSTKPCQSERAIAAANLWVKDAGKDYVCIDHSENFEPFFLQIVSSGNHWLFCSSDGALTAGRESSEKALFPYYTVDKIIDNWNTTGAWTAIVSDNTLWTPFQPSIANVEPIHRRILKSPTADEVVFDETHLKLGLQMTYRWRFSDQFGFVRSARLTNNSNQAVSFRIVDGLDNILPANVDSRMQLFYSCLTDAYKISELEHNGQLLVHRLAAGITDEAIPLECLRATTVWTHGLDQGTTYLSRRDAEQFLRGTAPTPKNVGRGKRGALIAAREWTLAPGESREWHFIAEIEQTQAQVSSLNESLADPDQLFAEVEADIEKGRQLLIERVASSDGFQKTADRDVSLYHFQNTLSNIMRGGVPESGYQLCRKPFLTYLQNHNRPLYENHRALLQALPEEITYQDLLAKVETLGDPDLLRLTREHLPLVMSRRHGDPSRPWNRFFIRQPGKRGEGAHHFEGNWRDIFQNWEALAMSHPAYLSGFIAKFLNASTIDGYNPYRITSNGVDWEAPDPEDPWASIGYWGDHQIIYLLKLLEHETKFHPENLSEQLNTPSHVSVDVPYRLKSWQDTLADPRDTVVFNWDRHDALMDLKKEIGGDGLLLRDSGNNPVRSTLLEKLLIPAAAKLANLIPGGGVWMNTQRPEWNDANNALAGNGLSVVTTAYLNRYLNFLRKLLNNSTEDSLTLGSTFAEFIETLSDLFADDRWKKPGTLSNAERFSLAKATGLAAEHYRTKVYRGEFGQGRSLDRSAIQQFLSNAQGAIEATLRINKREDGLWHAYNVMEIEAEAETFGIRHLTIMLEGQVAILSSGLLSTTEAADLLETMANSALRSQRHPTFLLYPDHDLPTFLEKNRVSPDQISDIPSLQHMSAENNGDLLVQDPSGLLRFQSNLTNAYALSDQLDILIDDSELGQLLKQDRSKIEDLYETTFQHQSFTGRSGTMFSYEGLGCVYWHMVSKLMVAAQESALAAANEDQTLFTRLASSYYTVQSGLGFRQTPQSYGAFPSEPYSHSPGHAGAQQPGLTGQVKEGILARFSELGVKFSGGKLSFRPHLLRNAEFNGNDDCPENTLSYTLAQIPIHYQRITDSNTASAQVEFADGSSKEFPDAALDRDTTRNILDHSGKITKIIVQVPQNWLIA